MSVMKSKKVADKVALKNPGIVDQIYIAFKQENIVGMIMGLIIGGSIPFGIFFVMHYEAVHALSLFSEEVTPKALHGLIMFILAVFGLLFSAKTVWQWGHEAFRKDVWKATGAVVILEGIMSLSSLQFLTIGALVLLVSINAIATGVVLSQGRRVQ